MDAEGKLQLLAGNAALEPAEEKRGEVPPRDSVAACGHSPLQLKRDYEQIQAGSVSTLETKKNSLGIHHAVMPGGKTIALLKTMMTSACERDCYYCPFRAGRDFRRATFKPDEMAKTFNELQRSRIAEGLFLSSGIAGGGVRTQDKFIDTIDVLRNQLNYRGYVHLKIMPGTERDQVYRAMQLSDRISINLEAPNSRRLADLAPHKVFMEELLQPLRWAEEIRKTQPARLGWNGKWPSLVTQFVVGAVGENDLEILSTTSYLIKQLRLARTYYSAFNPVTGTPLENRIDEVYSIAEFLDPDIFGPLFRFNREFYDLDEKGRPIGYKNLRALHRRLRPIMVRRRKDEVEDQLPPRTVKNYCNQDVLIGDGCHEGCVYPPTQKFMPTY